MTLTIKNCLQRAYELNIRIIGDVKFRGDCNKEDPDLASFFAWVRFNYPEYHSLIWHTENEFSVGSMGVKSYGYHAKSKAKGRLDSMADIVCLPIVENAPAFVCELKRVNIAYSLASKAQKEHFLKQIELLADQKKHGAFVCVALGFESAKDAFIEYVNRYKDKMRSTSMF